MKFQVLLGALALISGVFNAPTNNQIVKKEDFDLICTAIGELRIAANDLSVNCYIPAESVSERDELVCSLRKLADESSSVIFQDTRSLYSELENDVDTKVVLMDEAIDAIGNIQRGNNLIDVSEVNGIFHETAKLCSDADELLGRHQRKIRSIQESIATVLNVAFQFARSTDIAIKKEIEELINHYNGKFGYVVGQDAHGNVITESIKEAWEKNKNNEKRKSFIIFDCLIFQYVLEKREDSEVTLFRTNIDDSTFQWKDGQTHFVDNKYSEKGTKMIQASPSMALTELENISSSLLNSVQAVADQNCILKSQLRMIKLKDVRPESLNAPLMFAKLARERLQNAAASFRRSLEESRESAAKLIARN